MSLSQIKSQPALLLLADGSCFKGKAAGKIGTTTGEICFNTGMTGYQEVFSDPSYYKQILIMTTDHIGNYGAHKEEVESDHIKIAGMVCRNYSIPFSRGAANMSLQQYFEDNACVSITDIDTRALVRHIRHKGAMNAIISSEISDPEELKKMLAKVPDMSGLELSSEVSTSQSYDVGAEGSDIRIAVLDYGVKRNILNCFAQRGVHMRVFPARTGFEEMQAYGADGYFISNGPGDPAAMGYAVETVKQIQAAGKPIFGICLGHQLLALANGVRTYKMKNGHRGLNHPVKNIISGHCEITSQNHGFEVSREDVEKSKSVEITHVNLNDNTVEGIRVKGHKAFSVQYHPESSPGPHDSRYLFDDFLKMIRS